MQTLDSPLLLPAPHPHPQPRALPRWFPQMLLLLLTQMSPLEICSFSKLLKAFFDFHNSEAAELRCFTSFFRSAQLGQFPHVPRSARNRSGIHGPVGGGTLCLRALQSWGSGGGGSGKAEAAGLSDLSPAVSSSLAVSGLCRLQCRIPAPRRSQDPRSLCWPSVGVCKEAPLVLAHWAE